MKFQEAYDYQILKMTDTFYKRYPNPPFQEILQKSSRAYDCLLLQSHYDYFICIPYRSHISHPYAYHFKESARSRKSHSGLDYSKTAIIQNPEYITAESAIIDHDEYVETITNIEQIYIEAFSFIDDYCNHISGKKHLHKKEFERRYLFSPLKYFHRELGLLL